MATKKPTTKKPTTKKPTPGMKMLNWGEIATAARWIQLVADHEMRAAAEGKREKSTADELASRVNLNAQLAKLNALAKG